MSWPLLYPRHLEQCQHRAGAQKDVLHVCALHPVLRQRCVGLWSSTLT